MTFFIAQDFLRFSYSNGNLFFFQWNVLWNTSIQAQCGLKNEQNTMYQASITYRVPHLVCLSYAQRRVNLHKCGRRSQTNNFATNWKYVLRRWVSISSCYEIQSVLSHPIPSSSGVLVRQLIKLRRCHLTNPGLVEPKAFKTLLRCAYREVDS